MRKIFDSIDFTRVGLYQSILESHGIETHIKNLALSSNAMGEVPFAEVFPELWVVNDADYDEALRLLREYRESAPSGGNDWVCPKCGEQVPKEYEVCWNCETEKPEGV